MTERVLFGRSLLPGNASALSRAMSEAAAEAVARLPRWDVIPDALRHSASPAPLLPFLAWEWSVDEWSPAWPEVQKRTAIAASWDVHRVKGTVYALRVALDVLGLGAEVREWWSYGGAPYTFRLAATWPGLRPWTTTEFGQLTRVALRTKNVRSYLDRVSTRQAPVPTPVQVGMVYRSRTRHRPPVQADLALRARPPLFVAMAYRSRTRHRPQVTS